MTIDDLIDSDVVEFFYFLFAKMQLTFNNEELYFDTGTQEKDTYSNIARKLGSQNFLFCRIRAGCVCLHLISKLTRILHSPQ